jgi:hypothetical protein
LTNGIGTCGVCGRKKVAINVLGLTSFKGGVYLCPECYNSWCIYFASDIKWIVAHWKKAFLTWKNARDREVVQFT